MNDVTKQHGESVEQDGGGPVSLGHGAADGGDGLRQEPRDDAAPALPGARPRGQGVPREGGSAEADTGRSNH